MPDMRIVIALLALLSVSTSAVALFSSRIESVVRDGDELQIELSIARSGGCRPPPEFSSEAGAPPGTEVPSGAASFIVLIHQPQAVCTRAFTTARASLKLQIAPDVKTLFLFVPSLPHVAAERPFEHLTFDLAKAKPGNR
jgi:hypothetical protein